MDHKAVHRFDLNLVKVFLAIWELRSLTLAGEALGLTQPTISHALARLRDTFGDPLFLRVGNRMEPTATAIRMRAPFEEAVRLLGHTLGFAQDFDPALSDRSFRIVLTDTGEFVVLPRLLALLATEAPGVKIISVKFPPAEIEAALRSGRADMYVGYQPLLEEGASCQGHTLLSDRLICLLRRGHPALTQDWNRDLFSGLGFLDVSRDATGYGMGRAMLAEGGIDYHVVARLEHFTVLPEVVRRTDHAALFPYSVLCQMRPRDDLDFRELPFRIPSYDIKAWIHDLFAADPGIVWLRNALTQALQKNDGDAR
jgi:DNA-binding transcriptional LysR family regulator